MKKVFILTIILAMIGTAVAPQVQAQTQQQQQELEQIAKRSMNGLSAQDRARVVQIMTDVYVAQGMTRTQAAQFAQMAADNMFSDYQEDAQSAEARRLIEANEQQQKQNEQLSKQANEELRKRQLEEEQRKLYPGDTRGWPTTAVLKEYGHDKLQLKQPSGTNASYSGSTIYLSGKNADVVIKDLVSQLEKTYKKKMDKNENGYSLQYAETRYGDRCYVNIRQEDGMVIIRLWIPAA